MLILKFYFLSIIFCLISYSQIQKIYYNYLKIEYPELLNYTQSPSVLNLFRSKMVVIFFIPIINILFLLNSCDNIVKIFLNFLNYLSENA